MKRKKTPPETHQPLSSEFLLAIEHSVMDSAKKGLNIQGLDRQMCVRKEIGSEPEPAGRVNSWWHKCDPKERRRRGAFTEAFEIPGQPEDGLAKLPLRESLSHDDKGVPCLLD